MNALSSLQALLTGAPKEGKTAASSQEGQAPDAFASLMAAMPRDGQQAPADADQRLDANLSPELIAELERLSKQPGSDLNAELAQVLAQLPAAQSVSVPTAPEQPALTAQAQLKSDNRPLPQVTMTQNAKPTWNMDVTVKADSMPLEQFVEMNASTGQAQSKAPERAYSESVVEEAFALEKLPKEVLDLMKDILKTKTPDQKQVAEILELAEEAGPEIQALVRQFLEHKMAAVAEGSDYGRLKSQASLNQLISHQNQMQAQPKFQGHAQPSPALMNFKGAEGIVPLATSAEPAPITDLYGTSRPAQVMEHATIALPRGMTGNLGSDLAAALGNRLTLQVREGVREATVRLDPPELGKVDFSVRTENDKISIVINTTVAQTRDLVAQHLDRLRLDLMGVHDGEIDVQVGYQDGKSDSNQQQGRQDGVASNFAGSESMDESNQKQQKQSEHWLSITA